jgi:hypothetical protein
LAEARAYEDHVLPWLKHAAPSKSGLPGWTDMPEGSEEGEPPTHDEVLKLLRGVFMDLLLTDASLLVPNCGNYRCKCCLHRIRSREELEQTRKIAARLRKNAGGVS